ncbi:MaoC family dehydratase [Paracoccus saliphilus]|uniref:Acyl dehydratase n=2 Tax=Paracoccus saliphilus TaxID=405559 RepID=A0AA45W398_9RHOB|nr:MaoC family dehydratase [Paracoccus saliphilus]SIS75295.1 Acyl dehydratase [Paracoccus saliphilus]
MTNIDKNPAVTRWFEDFTLGEVFHNPSRTMTDGIFAMFQAASGDNDPIHYNLEYCQDRGHRDMLAHGMQTFIQTAAGAGTFPSQVADSLVGLIEFGGNILKPVYRNDTLYAKLEITDLIEQNTTGIIVMTASVENHQGIEVLSGFHKYLIRKRPDQA